MHTFVLTQGMPLHSDNGGDRGGEEGGETMRVRVLAITMRTLMREKRASVVLAYCYHTLCDLLCLQ
jgi:hypothetical protein